MFRREFLTRTAAIAALSTPFIAPGTARADLSGKLRLENSERAIDPRGPLRLRVGRALKPIDVRVLAELDYDANLTRATRISQSVPTYAADRTILLRGLGRPTLDETFGDSAVAGLIMTFPGNEGTVFCHAMSIGGAIEGSFSFHNENKEFTPAINLQPTRQRIKFEPSRGEVIGVAVKNSFGNTLAIIPPAFLADDLVENASGQGADRLKAEYRRIKSR